MSLKSQFLKPKEFIYEEDRKDTDPLSNTTFVYNPFVNHAIDSQRKKLPVFQYRNHVLYLLEKYQVVVIVGETGCGKSTQIPQYLIEAGWGEDGIVGVTEPRRVACTSLAARVAEEKDVLLGDLVGYSIRFDDCSTDKTKIKYMTEGLMIREMMADPLLRQYSVIILDEVHERTANTDIVLGLMKKILSKRIDLKLVVSSATVDAELFCEYFNFNKTDNKEKDTSVAISIKGRNFPVDIFYLETPCADYVKSSAETTLKIHRSKDPGDILVFLTGVEEVAQCIDLIKDGARGMNNELLVVPMHGSLSNREQLAAFTSAPIGMRKVVVATNIAETSVTIPGIVHVIDCGFMKLRWYNAKTYTDSLVIIPTSKASATQRAGRAGRIRSGKVYRLYTDEEFTKLPEATPPELTRSEMSTVITSLLALGITNILRFDYPTAPPARHLTSALDTLFALGAVDDSGELSEPDGQQMAEFPLSPLLAKVLIESGKYKCSSEILSIVAMLQVQDVFIVPGGKGPDAREKHNLFQVREGDTITLLNVLSGFEHNEMRKYWCSENFLNYKALKRAVEIKNNISKLLRNFNIPITSCGGDTETVCKCLTSGMFPNTVYYHHSGVYKSVRGQQDMYIHPSSVLYTQQKPPPWLLFNEVLHTSRVFIRDLTVISPEWLLEIAPHFFEKTSHLRSAF